MQLAWSKYKINDYKNSSIVRIFFKKNILNKKVRDIK